METLSKYEELRQAAEKVIEAEGNYSAPGLCGRGRVDCLRLVG
jgi:hypothetical protein